MRKGLLIAALFGVASIVSPAARAAETGTLKVRFVYAGSAVKPAALVVDKDVEFCGRHPLVNERLLVNPQNNGIQNMVMYVYTGRGGSKLPQQSESDKTYELANEKCRFEPRVVVMQVGDTLKITNPDAVGHNANINFLVNTAQNITIPPGAEKLVKIEKPEPAPIPVVCNIHPWMIAHVVALDHPFAAVTDEDGELEISGLPSGEKLAFRLNHEAADGALKEIKIGDETVSVSRNVVELMVKPGVNDYTITIPAGALKAD